MNNKIKNCVINLDNKTVTTPKGEIFYIQNNIVVDKNNECLVFKLSYLNKSNDYFNFHSIKELENESFNEGKVFLPLLLGLDTDEAFDSDNASIVFTK